MTPLFQETKEAIALTSVLSRYGFPKPKSNMLPCPFHDDNTPSMSVKNNYYHCFACGASGDVISFVQRLFRLQKPIDAVKKLRHDFGLSPCNKVDNEAVRSFREEQLYGKAFDLWEKRAFIEMNTYLRETVPILAVKYKNNAKGMKRLYEDYSTLEHILDVLTYGSKEDKIEIYKKYRRIVRKCVERNKMQNAELI